MRCPLSLIIVMMFAGLSSVNASGPLEDGRQEKLQAKVRAFFDALAREDYEAACKDFDDAVRKASPPDKLKEVWQTLRKQLGALKKQGEPRLEKVGKYDAIVLPCEFEKITLDARIAFDADGKIAGYGWVPAATKDYKVPDYVKRESFREVDLKVNAAGEWELPATLSMPIGEGPYPAVVLVHGSGPNDRDETILSNKPFRDLAWGLSSRGIAVLRYEKRTRAHGSRMTAKNFPTLKEEVTDDALAAVALLRTIKEIDPQRVFVLGHSLGGLMAARIGEADPRLAGLIVMAGNTRPLEDLVVEQFTYLYSLEGLTDKQKQELEELKKKAARVKHPKLSADTPGKELPLGVPGVYWLSLREVQPVETAAKLRMPMLILQGERDYQVTMEDFGLWKRGLAGKENAKLKSYPKLNHLFMEGEGKSKPAEYMKASHVAAEVIEDIASWVKQIQAADESSTSNPAGVVWSSDHDGMEAFNCGDRRCTARPHLSIRILRGGRHCRPAR